MEARGVVRGFGWQIGWAGGIIRGDPAQSRAGSSGEVGGAHFFVHMGLFWNGRQMGRE
jgi:hypothetical protein